MRSQVSGATIAKLGAVLTSYTVYFTLILLMTQADFGRFSQLMAIASIATMVVSLGHPQVLLRSTAAQFATGVSLGLSHIWRMSHVWIIGTSSIILICVGLWWIGSGRRAPATELFWVALILPFWACLKLYAALLHGNHLTTIAQVAETVLRPLYFLIGIVVFVAMFRTEITLAGALALNSLAFMLAFKSTYVVCKWKETFHLVQSREGVSGHQSGWFRASVSLSLISASQLLILNVDLLMIGQMLSDEDAAVYRVAILVMMIVGSFNEVVNLVISPRIAAAHANGNLAEFIPKMRRLALFAALLCIVALVVFGVLGDAMLRLAFGEDYVNAYTATLLLIGGQVIAAFLGPVGMLLNMTRHEWAHFRLTLFALALNIALNYLLIPLFGIVGAAFASLATILFVRLSGLFLFVRLSGIKYFRVQKGT